MNSPAKPDIAVYCAEPAALPRAHSLAAQLQLPLADTQDHGHAAYVVVRAERLELVDPTLGPRAAVYGDFLSGKTGYRLQRERFRHELLARALGSALAAQPTVIDATAGLGRDGLLMACLGCRVAMLERSPVLHALLSDALQRARSDDELRAVIDGNVTTRNVDAMDYLRALPPEQRPDVIYMDPMFPSKKKSALVKKEMRVLRAAVGDDEDAAELLRIARQRATKRVIVKRFVENLPLAPGVTTSVRGKSNRFDIYVSL